MRDIAGMLIGMLAAAVALGVALLASGFVGPQADPVVAVGDVAINHTPIPVKDFAIAHFGSHDKQVLVLGILVILAAFAAVLGIVAMRWLRIGLAGLALFGVIGGAAALTRPNASTLAVIPVLLGVAAAAATLILLRAVAPSARSALPGRRRLAELGPAAGPDQAPAPEIVLPARLVGPAGGALSMPRPSRRNFVALSAAAAAVAAVGGLVGEALLSRFNVNAARAAVRLPAPAITGPLPPAAARLPVPGITPFTTVNTSFYRVDTEIVLPQISPEKWKLRVHGMVDHELELSYDDLLRRPLTEADITLVCVSNQVGGKLNGNARWLGASLASLLREAGPQAGADQILSTSSDGWTCGTPLATVMSDPNAMLAVGMNGQPLPIEHGFPARMMVPGLYGYVSATKWVVDLEITTFADAKSYWVQRGYSVQGPIKTMSRIDVPKPFQSVAKGRVAVAGVAWAPHRGIRSVHVQVDSAPWQEARLAAVPSSDTWRQWVWEWDATPGLHQIQVRATDATGATQPEKRISIFPNGATGWDSTAVTVT